MKAKPLLAAAFGCLLLNPFNTNTAEAGFNIGRIVGDIIGSAGSSIPSSNKDSATVKKNRECPPYTGPLDPLPPDEPTARPDWFDNRTFPQDMSNARLCAECENMEKWRERSQHTVGWFEPDMCRYEELEQEITDRIRMLDRYADSLDFEGVEGIKQRQAIAAKPTYKRAVASDMRPLYKYGLDQDDLSIFAGYKQI